MQKIIFIFLAYFIVTTFIGCSRPNKELSLVTIKTPSKTQSFKGNSGSVFKTSDVSAFATSLECYAVSITGPGINSNSRACGPTTGVIGGFVGAGQTLTVEVPKGIDRVITVYLYYTPPGQTSCPSWSNGFDDLYGTNYNFTYKLKEQGGITLSKTEESLTIDVVAPTVDSETVLKQMGVTSVCTPQPSSFLQSNGTVSDTNGNNIAWQLDAPIIESISQQIIGDISLSSLLLKSSSSVAFSPVSEIEIPPYLRSIIKHPSDNTKVIGMRDDGILEEVSLSSGTTTELDATNCPFDSCQVPVWFKSITLGPARNIFGLDHGGGFYYMYGTEPLAISGVTVPEYVEQVSF